MAQGSTRENRLVADVTFKGGETRTTIAVRLSSANLLGMFATPVPIIGAPPAGYALIVHQVVFVMTRTGTAYANGGAVSLVYHGGSTPAHSGSVPASVVTTGGAGVAVTQLGPAAAANGTTVPTATGLDLTNASGAFITGTGTALVRVAYSIVKTT